jgi:hypothetical protein
MIYDLILCIRKQLTKYISRSVKVYGVRPKTSNAAVHVELRNFPVSIICKERCSDN